MIPPHEEQEEGFPFKGQEYCIVWSCLLVRTWRRERDLVFTHHGTGDSNILTQNCGLFLSTFKTTTSISPNPEFGGLSCRGKFNNLYIPFKSSPERSVVLVFPKIKKIVFRLVTEGNKSDGVTAVGSTVGAALVINCKPRGAITALTARAESKAQLMTRLASTRRILIVFGSN